jgi:hypothetical protein
MSTESDLLAALDAGLISREQHERIVTFLHDRQPPAPAPAIHASPPKFDLTHVLWYAGALLIMGAMGLFTTEAFNRLGGWALAAIGAIYAFGLTLLGRYFWRVKDLKTPGGLLIAAAVAMAPLTIYGIQDALDLWRQAEGGNPGQYRGFYWLVKGSFFWMELGTMAATAVALRFFPFPFILLVGSIAAWFMSMDLAMWFTATPVAYNEFETRRITSMIFGIAMIALSWALDLRRKPGAPDFAFWLHLFGALAFWGGLTQPGAGSPLVYCLINVGLVCLGVFLRRRIYVVLGALGIAGYVGYLSYKVFKDAILFSIALTAVGLAVIGLGLALYRQQNKISAKVDALLPGSLKWLRPAPS